MIITSEHFARLYPKADYKIAAALSHAMNEFGITTESRCLAFLAQMSHESQGFTKLVENLNYSAARLAAVWPSRYSAGTILVKGKKQETPNALAIKLAGKPQALANNVYANRMGNGNEASGDGWRYRGRGFKMITGKTNYSLVGNGIGSNLLLAPELLEQYDTAARASAWMWVDTGLNKYADVNDFDTISKIINVGRKDVVIQKVIGYQARRDEFKRLTEAFA